MMAATGAGARRAALPLIFCIWLSACAGLPPAERHSIDIAVHARRTEVQSPFFPQEIHQCGPAALASTLNWAGVAVTPSTLADEIYLPNRKGSLQLELIAATRRHARIPYVLDPSLAVLIAEVQAGHPVVVLQNLAFNWYPRWHYAVVIGYDLERGVLILHSGREERDVMALGVFLHTWNRSGRWALLTLPAQRIPATADEGRYLQAVSDLEQQGHSDTAFAAYTQALQRWPESLVAQIGLGNIAYMRGEFDVATTYFLAAVHSHPESAAAHNNLAYALAEQGRLDEAEAQAREALLLAGTDNREATDTLTHIQRLRGR